MVWYIWAILGVAAIVFEIASPTFFALFVGVGFLCSALLSFFMPDSLIFQLMTSLIGMFVALAVFKRRKLATSPASKIGQSDECVGIKGHVLEEITPSHDGVVKLSEAVLGSSQWRAKSDTNEHIPQNSFIEIVRVKGQVLIVKPIID